MNLIQNILSEDTTGSMNPCLHQVKRHIRNTTRQLFQRAPNMQLGIIAHGDYCDAGSAYVTKHFPFSTNPDMICDFVDTVGGTGGGDLPECYERVLFEARTCFTWSPEARSKNLVMIGDDVPHPVSYHLNRGNLDWRKEAGALAAQGVTIHSVQCLGKQHADKFWRELAEIGGGYHLTLDQFASINDLILAVCFQQQGGDVLQKFEEEVVRAGRMDRSMDRIFTTLAGRSATRSPRFAKRSDGLVPVPEGRFQILHVNEDQSIRDFVETNGLIFKKGRGFYELTKPELVQEGKEVIVVDRVTGDKFTGDQARRMIGAPPGERIRVRPTDLDDFMAFVQSTSYNRKLVGGTRFLYEVEMAR